MRSESEQAPKLRILEELEVIFTPPPRSRYTYADIHGSHCAGLSNNSEFRPVSTKTKHINVRFLLDWRKLSLSNNSALSTYLRAEMAADRPYQRFTCHPATPLPPSPSGFSEFRRMIKYVYRHRLVMLE